MAPSRGFRRRVADDTIVAIATPLGEAGLGVVRLSGRAALSIVAALFETRIKLTSASTHTLHTGWIKKGRDKIDQVVAAVFRAPHSYTGENIVEISCHGSPALLQSVVKLALSKGARLAKPGEFTERAYLNGKMDLVQAEAVAELIHAGAGAARRAALEQLRGNLSARIKTIREALVGFLAHLEANLDFVEEDIPGLPRKKMARDLQKIHDDAQQLLSTSLRGRLLREGLRVTLVGRPNVGKSSLFNALLASERAIVTDVPGTTRDVLEEKLEWEGIAIVLSDTAGLRETNDVVEKEGARRSRNAREQANLVLFVLDGSAPFSDEDQRIADELTGKTVVTVLNKIDRGRTIKPAGLPFKTAAVVETSATDATGLSDLKKAVTTLALGGGKLAREGGTVTNLRHVSHLEKAAAHIAQAQAAVKAGQSEEAPAVAVRAALREIDAITGASAGEEVLDAIFRQFCIGK